LVPTDDSLDADPDGTSMGGSTDDFEILSGAYARGLPGSGTTGTSASSFVISHLKAGLASNGRGGVGNDDDDAGGGRSNGFGNGFGHGNGKASMGPPPLQLRAVAMVHPPGTTIYPDSEIQREEYVRLVLQSLKDIGYQCVTLRSLWFMGTARPETGEVWKRR
jgi:hypothetical protein